MKRYSLLALVIAVVVIVSFVTVEALEIPLLTDPSELIGQGGFVAAILGVGLLLADIFIPVPSSIIMIALGAAFGVLGGFLLALGASLGGALIGWWIGKKGSAWTDRFVSPREQARAQAFLARHGMVAVVLSRSIPVLSETVAIMAGAARMDGKAFFFGALLGTIPPTLVYAIAGSMTTAFAPGAAIAAGVMLLAGLAWWLSRRYLEPSAKRHQADA